MRCMCRNVECEQVNVPSADLTVAQLQLPDRSVLLASVYVEASKMAALSKRRKLLDDAINTAHRRSGPRLDVMITGDFNFHGQSWVDDEVAPR